MSRAVITQQFPDGTAIECEVETGADSPDAASDCVSRVLDLWRAAVVEDADSDG